MTGVISEVSTLHRTQAILGIRKNKEGNKEIAVLAPYSEGGELQSTIVF